MYSQTSLSFNKNNGMKDPQLNTLPDRIYFREHRKTRTKYSRPDIPRVSSEASGQSSAQDFTTHHSQNSNLEWVLAD